MKAYLPSARMLAGDTTSGLSHADSEAQVKLYNELHTRVIIHL